MSKTALILGIGGQDGSYLAELLLDKGYAVHGMYRRSSVDNLWRIKDVRDRITLHVGDVTDASSVARLVRELRPYELYNLADQDHVGASHHSPGASLATTLGGCLNALEAVRGGSPSTRFFQPISTTVFGTTRQRVTLDSPLHPESPYAVAKAAAWMLCRHYRAAHGVWVACGVLGNHDSPRRGPDYLLQKIVRAAREGQAIELYNPDDTVDVGYAGDYVWTMRMTLQQSSPEDYMIVTGVQVTIGSIVRAAYSEAGLVGPFVTWKYGEAASDQRYSDSRSWTRLGHAPQYDAGFLAREMVGGRVK